MSDVFNIGDLANPKWWEVASQVATPIFTFCTLSVAVWISIRQQRHTNRIEQNKNYLDIRKRYAEREIGDAVKALWDIYEETKDNSISGDPFKINWAFIDGYYQSGGFGDTNLYDQRRLVAHFYSLVADLLALDGLRKEQIAACWDRDSLEIIPKIIIPIELLLAKVNNPGKLFHEKKFNSLLDVYLSSPQKDVPLKDECLCTILAEFAGQELSNKAVQISENRNPQISFSGV